MTSEYGAVIREIFGHNLTDGDPSVCKSNSLVTCSHPRVFIYYIGVHSIDSSKMAEVTGLSSILVLYIYIYV